jgi:hypothetical protein
MATNDLSTPPLHVDFVLPNGPALLARIHENIVTNFRKDQPPIIHLPPIWRLAAHVVKEKTPLVFYRFEQEST